MNSEPTESARTPSNGGEFDQDATLSSRPSGVTCPRCHHEELMIGDVASCQFAGCQNCRGMLFQQDVFLMLINHLRATSTMPPEVPPPLDRDQLDVRRSCPACAGPLETHAYGGAGNAVIDTCIGCGLVWFDHGELNNLVQAPGKR